jgi:hypothetical protein
MVTWDANMIFSNEVRKMHLVVWHMPKPSEHVKWRATVTGRQKVGILFLSLAILTWTGLEPCYHKSKGIKTKEQQVHCSVLFELQAELEFEKHQQTKYINS